MVSHKQMSVSSNILILLFRYSRARRTRLEPVAYARFTRLLDRSFTLRRNILVHTTDCKREYKYENFIKK